MTILGDGRWEKRRAMKHGVRTRIIPHLRALGFEQTRTKANRERWSFYEPWNGAYGRMRGIEADFVDIYWEKYGGPKFKFFVSVSRDPDQWRLDLLELGPTLGSGYYGLPWGLLGFGGVWFGPGQSAEAAIELAVRRLSELDRILREGDAVAFAKLQADGFLERAPSFAAWWLDHVGTDVPKIALAVARQIHRPTGSARP